MSHKNVLKLLFPIELGGDFDKDIEIEGQHLDAAQTRAAEIVPEMFPDTADELLNDWHRVTGISLSCESIQIKRDKIIQKLRETGGLSIPYFTNIVLKMGYSLGFIEGSSIGFEDTTDVSFVDTTDTAWQKQSNFITIEEYPYQPLIAGIMRAGESMYIPEVIFIWKIGISGWPIYYFRAGESGAGESLMTWSSQSELEDILKKLKPAHTYLEFIYS